MLLFFSVCSAFQCFLTADNSKVLGMDIVSYQWGFLIIEGVVVVYSQNG